MLVVYKDQSKSPYYKPLLEDNVKDDYLVFIVICEGPGLPSFSKGSHIENVPTNPFTPLGNLTKGQFLIFNGSLYRQEPEVKGEGVVGILLRYY